MRSSVDFCSGGAAAALGAPRRETTAQRMYTHLSLLSTLGHPLERGSPGAVRAARTHSRRRVGSRAPCPRRLRATASRASLPTARHRSSRVEGVSLDRPGRRELRRRGCSPRASSRFVHAKKALDSARARTRAKPAQGAAGGCRQDECLHERETNQCRASCRQPITGTGGLRSAATHPLPVGHPDVERLLRRKIIIASLCEFSRSLRLPTMGATSTS